MVAVVQIRIRSEQKTKKPKTKHQKSLQNPNNDWKNPSGFFRWEAVRCQRSREKNLQVKISGECSSGLPEKTSHKGVEIVRTSSEQQATRNTSLFSSFLHMTTAIVPLQLSHHKQLTTTPLQRNILKVPGKVTPCKLVTSCKFWLRLLPNVKLCRPSGKVTGAKLLFEETSKSQALQTDKAELLNFLRGFEPHFSKHHAAWVPGARHISTAQNGCFSIGEALFLFPVPLEKLSSTNVQSSLLS